MGWFKGPGEWAGTPYHSGWKYWGQDNRFSHRQSGDRLWVALNAGITVRDLALNFEFIGAGIGVDGCFGIASLNYR